MTSFFLYFVLFYVLYSLFLLVNSFLCLLHLPSSLLCIAFALISHFCFVFSSFLISFLISSHMFVYSPISWGSFNYYLIIIKKKLGL